MASAQTDSIASVSTIAPYHIAHLLDEGFTPDQIQDFAKLGVRSVSATEAHELGFLTRDSTNALVSRDGLLFPFTSTFSQLRLDQPIIRKNGSVAKYLTPCKRQAQAMTPAQCEVHTEGWKDAQAGSLHGNVPTGALAGVSHYRKALKEGSGGVILFDADGWINPSVFRSLFNAGMWIDGKVNLLPEIPGQPKAGLCEYFKVGHTAKDYRALIDNAMSPEAFLLTLPSHWKNLPAERMTEAVEVAMRLAAKHLKPLQHAVLISRVAKGTGIERRRIAGVLAKELRRQNGTPLCLQTQRIQAVNKVWGDRIRLNLLSQKLELDGEPIKSSEVVYLDLAEQHQIEMPKGEALDIVLRLARQREYHPVREYLMSVDGSHGSDTSILDDLATRYFGAADPIFNVYMKKFLIGAVARVMRPGCKLDTVPVLQGKQGEQKSAFWETIAGKGVDGSKWFDDSLGDCGDKDEKMKLYRTWFMEWAELEHVFKRKELGAVKAFLTSSVDVLRVPYGRSVDEFPRHSVIVGTSNEDDFLADPTGDRRYWVIPVLKEIDLELLRQERDRIWAAALNLFLQGEQWWLTREEQAISTTANDEWRSDDPWSDAIAAYIKNFDFVTISEALEFGVEVEVGRQGKAEQMRVSAILKRLGWKKDRGMNSLGVQVRGWRKVEAVIVEAVANDLNSSLARPPRRPPVDEVVYEVVCAEMQEQQYFEESRLPRPPFSENQTISEKSVELTEAQTLTEKVCSEGGLGGLSSLLKPETLQQVLSEMQSIDSVQSSKKFHERHQKRSKAQQQQILDAFTTQVDGEQQVRFYECWQQFETLETAVEPVQEPEPAQESVGRNKWVYARLQVGGETLVRVLAEKFNSITVHVPGTGSKSIKPSEVIRVSEYTGD